MGSTLRYYTDERWKQAQENYDELCTLEKLVRACTARLKLKQSPEWGVLSAASDEEARRIASSAKAILQHLNQLEYIDPTGKPSRKPSPLRLEVPPDASSNDTLSSDQNLIPFLRSSLEKMRTRYVELLKLQQTMVSPSELRPPRIPRWVVRLTAAAAVLIAVLVGANALKDAWLQSTFQHGEDAIASARAAQAEAAQSVRAPLAETKGEEAAATPEVQTPSADPWAEARQHWNDAIHDFTMTSSFFLGAYHEQASEQNLSVSYEGAVELELAAGQWETARTLTRRFAATGINNVLAARLLDEAYIQPASLLFNERDFPGVRAILDAMPTDADGKITPQAEMFYQASFVEEAHTAIDDDPPNWESAVALLEAVRERPNGTDNQEAIRLLGEAYFVLAQEDMNAAHWDSARGLLEPLLEQPFVNHLANVREVRTLLSNTYYLPARELLADASYEEARELLETLLALPDGEDHADAQTLYYDTFYLPAQQAVASNDYDTARSLLEPLYNLNPAYRSTQTLLSNTYYELGVTAINEGDLDGAQSNFEAVRAISPSYRDMNTLLVDVYYQQADSVLASSDDASGWVRARPYLNDLNRINADYRDAATLLRESYYVPASTTLEQGFTLEDAEQCIEARETFEDLPELENYRDTAVLLHETYYCEILANIASDDMDEARSAVQILSQLSPHFRDIESLYNQTYYLPAVEAIAAEDWETARALLRPLLAREQFYNDSFILLRESYYRPGAAAFEAQNWTTARRELIPLVMGDGTSAAIDLTYRDAYDLLREAYYRPGAAAFEAQGWNAARQHLLPLHFAIDTSVPIDPNYLDSFELLRNAYYVPASTALESGDYLAVREALRPLLFGSGAVPAVDANYLDSQTLLRESYYRAASEALEAGEWERARAELQPLLTGTSLFPALDPEYRDTQTLLRESYYRAASEALEAGEWERVRAELEPLLVGTSSASALDPEYRDAQILLRESYYRPGREAVENGDWAAGRAFLQPLLVRIDSSYRDATYWLRESYYRPGTAALKSQNWTIARLHLDALVELDPDYRNAASLLFEAYYNPGRLALDNNDWNYAYQLLSEALHRAPNSSLAVETESLVHETYYRPGQIAFQEQDWTTARRYLQPIKEINYRDAAALYRDTYVVPVQQAVENGDLTAARNALADFRQAYPADGAAYRELLLSTYDTPLRVAVEQGDWVSAGEQYVELWRQNPPDSRIELIVREYPELWNQLAVRFESYWYEDFFAGPSSVITSDNNVTALALSGSGLRVLTGGGSGLINIWNRIGTESLYTLFGGTHAINAIALDPRGQWFATATDTKVQMWDMQTGQPRRELEAHDERINSLAVSLDGTMLASAGDDRSLHVWSSDNLLDAAEYVSLPLDDRAAALAFSPDNRHLVAALADGRVLIFDLSTSTVTANTAPGAYIREIVFHPNGEYFITASNDSDIRLWRLDGSLLGILSGHNDWVRSISVNGNGTLLASAGADGSLILWSLETQRIINQHNDFSGDLVSVRFSMDGGTLALAFNDRMVRVWTVQAPDSRSGK